MDVDLDAGGTLDDLVGPLSLDERDRRDVETDTARARFIQTVARLHLTMEALEPADPEAGDDALEGALIRREVDLLAAPNLVVTVHRGRIGALERFEEGLTGDTSLGVLSAADLVSSLVDEVITGYYGLAEAIEQEIDLLDQAALRSRKDHDVLAEIVAIRRRIGVIRRTLTPHRSALAALARPETQADAESVGQPWPGLVDRMEGALAAIEALRDTLLGTYDIHMGRTAQRANEVMKALTLLSALLLPALVLGGIMGMNFDVPIFEETGNFYVVVGAMAGFVLALLGFAKWRDWL